jgi:hypothetical protein
VSSDKLRELLRRAGELAGIDEDLSEVFDRAQSDRDREVEQIRESLPNQRTRKAFDKELRRQEVQHFEKNRKKAEKFRKANARQLEKLRKRLNLDNKDNPYPHLIPAHDWMMVKEVQADLSGFAAKYHAKTCPHKIAVTIIHRSALSYDGEAPKYSYVGESRGAKRARAILAIGLLIVRLSVTTGRKGQGWNRLVKGIPRAALVAALTDPRSKAKLHPNTLDGRHRKAPKEATDGRVGYLNALKSQGLFYTRQAHWREGEDPRRIKGWHDIGANEMPSTVHPSGWKTSLARYWVVSDQYIDAKNAEKRAKLWIAWLAGCLSWAQDEEGRPVPEITYQPETKSASPSG